MQPVAQRAVHDALAKPGRRYADAADSELVRHGRQDRRPSSDHVASGGIDPELREPLNVRAKKLACERAKLVAVNRSPFDSRCGSEKLAERAGSAATHDAGLGHELAHPFSHGTGLALDALADLRVARLSSETQESER
jgi:hypothetical protein